MNIRSRLFKGFTTSFKLKQPTNPPTHTRHTKYIAAIQLQIVCMRIVCIGEFRNGDSSKMCKITWMSPRVHEARLSLFSRFLRFVDLKCKFNEGMVHKEILFMRVAYPGECVIRQCKYVNIEQIVREIKPFSMCCALRSTVFFFRGLFFSGLLCIPPKCVYLYK